MKHFFLLITLFIISTINAQQSANSQNQFELVNLSNATQFNNFKKSSSNIEQAKLTNQNLAAIIVSNPIKITLKNITPFLAISCGWNEVNNSINKNSIIKIRFSTNGNSWDEWKKLELDEHSTNTKYQFVSQLLFEKKEYQFYQLHITTNIELKGNILKDVFLNFFSPGDGIKPNNINENNSPSVASRTTACPCPQPSFVNRIGWGCPQGAISYSYTTVSHLIVHHSAGSNTSTNWPSVVLSIWNSHVYTNGFADIGYNWLVDPNGQLYEGRGGGNNVTGAHFCGYNAGTMGTCMLGTFTSQNVTDTARKKLVEILSWKACNSSLNPTGTAFHASSNLNLNTISGHRDGCATECPGNMFYPSLPNIRTEVSNYINNVCNVTSLPVIQGVESLSISPNPTTGTFIISIKLNSTKAFRYDLINSEGKIIYSSTTKQTGLLINEKVTLLQRMPSGSYIVKISIDKSVVSKTIIKQ